MTAGKKTKEDTWGRPLEYYLICSDSFNPASAAVFRPRIADWLKRERGQVCL